MQNQIAALLSAAKTAIAKAEEREAIEQLKVHYLGKKGELTALLKAVADCPPAERPNMGKLVNQAKQEVQTLLAERETLLNAQILQNRLATETIDITLP